MIQTVYVQIRGDDPRGAEVLHETGNTLGIKSVQKVHAVKVYRLEGLSLEQVDVFAAQVLCDPVTQMYTIDSGERLPEVAGTCRIEVAYQQGVMNPEAASIEKAARDRRIDTLQAADSSWQYRFEGELSLGDLVTIITRLLVNKTVERIITDDADLAMSLQSLLVDWASQEEIQRIVTAVPTTLCIANQVSGVVSLVPICELSASALAELAEERQLHLTTTEMEVLQRHFHGLQREPTDVEVETVAQTWSEHCGHKTFKAKIVADGVEKEPLITRLMRKAKQHGKGVLSSFEDNSGVIEFYDGYAVCGKVETHNSPSALEPYGGAMTGSGGVFRDILGTAQGARVLMSTDMFCVARPDLPLSKLPAGCLHSRRLLRQVVNGVRDYGNRMGIPTANGSVYFHDDFRAKPAVIVGAYGILPANNCQKGVPQPGDVIVVVGGRTGRDGIHGATFSSGVMTDRTSAINARAVQIGNAIEEKRTFEATLYCRDRGWIRALTDCGAGGFSSAIGEMGARTGARVTLEKALLKYPGLASYEIWISESQERMVLAVAPENVDRVQEACSGYNVEATVLGVFTDDHRLTVTYAGTTVCDLSMEFLHDGLPQRVMVACKPQPVALPQVTIPKPASAEEWIARYEAVLAHGNVCSKEPIVRMYDHTVQGTNVLPPFSGVQHDGPNDAVVIRPLSGKPYGLVVAHGMNPILNQLDPYLGSLWAAVEALSNYVAVGGNFREAALIDNFIWPFPDEESLWGLDQAMDACLAIMDAFGIPFVSGKDSLSGTYRRKEFLLKILPVLCVSVFGRIPDVSRTVTGDFKRVGSHIVLLGDPDAEAMGGSVYYDVHGATGNRVPEVTLRQLPYLFDWLCDEIRVGGVLACHDVSQGGLAATLAEMCFGGGCGARIKTPYTEPIPATPNFTATGKQIGMTPSPFDGRVDHWLFNETAGCFLLEVSSRHYRGFMERVSMGSLDCHDLGMVTEEPMISVAHDNQTLFTVPVPVLKTAWQEPMKEVFR